MIFLVGGVTSAPASEPSTLLNSDIIYESENEKVDLNLSNIKWYALDEKGLLKDPSMSIPTQAAI